MWPATPQKVRNYASYAGYKADVEERAALTADSVPERYLDAWARIKFQRQWAVARDDAWRRAVDDGGRFLDARGNLAVELGRETGNLFDVPSHGKPGGLAWALDGETLHALGPQHGVTESGRVLERRP